MPFLAPYYLFLKNYFIYTPRRSIAAVIFSVFISDLQNRLDSILSVNCCYFIKTLIRRIKKYVVSLHNVLPISFVNGFFYKNPITIDKIISLQHLNMNDVLLQQYIQDRTNNIKNFKIVITSFTLQNICNDLSSLCFDAYGFSFFFSYSSTYSST